MSLINIQNGNVAPTVAQKQLGLVTKVTSILNTEIQGDLTVFQNVINLIWNNNTLTPQEVFDGFGTNAGQLFTIASAFITFINTVAPNSLTFTAPKTYTINQDGSVTVTS